ncbi:MAG: right-handed parallel beta-helix repeat-containing protein, partial [Acidobacteria bacterium]|nr:right-handed parallel beta-helix repeat-containing protein [Acidobacteriota bacterium]
MKLCFGFLAIAFSLAIPSFPAAQTGACAVQTGGSSIRTMNSWVVDGDLLVQNQTIKLAGTLDIRSGTLMLRNVALEINGTQSSDWLSGAVAAINIAPGAGLAISGSRITATSGAPGVVAGDQVTSVAADSTCFNHMGVSFLSAGAVKFHHNEFVLTGSDNVVVATIVNSTGAEFEDNTIQFALDPHAASAPHGANGVYLFYTHDSTILRNTITGAVNGISLWGSWNNHVVGNTWKGPMALSGFDTQAANWWSLSIPNWSGEAGIGLDHWSNNNVVENNTLMGAHSAILFVKQSVNNTISQNTITGAGYGITLRWASHTLVDGNELTDVYDNAIHAHRSHDNTITNNRIYKSGGGVALFASESNIIKSNAVADSDRGIFLHESAKNIIDGNTISGAVQGVFVTSFSSGNGVTSNNIIASDHPAWDEGQNNSWKGNFWGAVSGSQRAIPPATAADGAPATAMMPLAAVPVVPLMPLPFKAPLHTVTTIQNQQ